MQREPIQFGAMTAFRAKRSAAGMALGHAVRNPSRDLATASELDEAFADFSRFDAGSSTSDPRVATRELIAEISTQLKSLDSQRRQLARLLAEVSPDVIV
jgi:hypothetical protein